VLESEAWPVVLAVDSPKPMGLPELVVVVVKDSPEVVANEVVG
jgi:hypothetical protein